jgi:hypothetical protein
MNITIRTLHKIFLIIFIAIPSAFAENGLSLQDQAIQVRKQIEAGPPRFSLIGKIEKGAQSEYSVNNEDFIIDSNTRISGSLTIGRSATVMGDRIGGRNYAKKITVDTGSDAESKDSNEQERLAEAPILGDGPQPLRLP